MKTRLPYAPDYVTYPGCMIGDLLEELEISARELARRCGRSAKMISELIAGKAALEPETALQLERVLKVDARIWLNAEAEYRLRLACQLEGDCLSGQADWLERFPIDELRSRGYLSSSSVVSTQIRDLLKFFGVGSIAACDDKFSEIHSVAFRHSPTFASREAALLAWLRVGEIEAQKLAATDYNRAGFLDALRTARTLTNRSVAEALPDVLRLCRNSGVALVIEPAFSKVALSGASRWLSPRQALIQQTLRHKTNDHFWFTFFHEAAHILLHSRKYIFIDGDAADDQTIDQETEANTWASNFLIPEAELTKFIVHNEILEDSVRSFAEMRGIAPAIVVGQLQHRKVIGFGQLNRLKERLDVDQLTAMIRAISAGQAESLT